MGRLAESLVLSSRAGKEEKLGNLLAVVGFGLEGALTGLGAACRTAAGLTALGGARVGVGLSGTLGCGSLSGCLALGVGLRADGGCLERGVRGADGSSGTATAGSGMEGRCLCRGVSGSSGKVSLGLGAGCLDLGVGSGCLALGVGSGCLDSEGLRGSSLAGAGSSCLTGERRGRDVLLGTPDGVGLLGSSICSLGLCCGAACVTLGGCPRGRVVTPGTAGTAGKEGSWGAWGAWGSLGLGGGRGRCVRVACGILLGGRDGPTNCGLCDCLGAGLSGSAGPTNGDFVAGGGGRRVLGAAVDILGGSGVLKTVLGGFSLMELGVVTWKGALLVPTPLPPAAASASSSYSYS